MPRDCSAGGFARRFRGESARTWAIFFEFSGREFNHHFAVSFRCSGHTGPESGAHAGKILLICCWIGGTRDRRCKDLRPSPPNRLVRKMPQKFSTREKLVKIGTQFLVKIGQNWSKLVRIGQNWSKLVKIGQNWSKLGNAILKIGGETGYIFGKFLGPSHLAHP